jgi:hypothetical protein
MKFEDLHSQKLSALSSSGKIQHNQDIQIRITLKNNVYRRLKSQNANRQLDLNAVLLKDEMEFIKQYLNTYFSHINLIQPIDKRLVFRVKEKFLASYI